MLNVNQIHVGIGIVYLIDQIELLIMVKNVLETKNVGVIDVQEIIKIKMQLNGVQEYVKELHKIEEI